MTELVVDNFAGGGGASVGIEDAIGGTVDIAINHDAAAIAMHEANHPGTHHYQEDIWQVNPVQACKGQRVGLAWFSPDCKHFSRAKGGAPKRSKEIRSLAWTVTYWAGQVRPRVIILENVEEFEDWGPLDAMGRPDKDKMGETFKQWVAALQDLGYKVEWRSLVAADYGAPTTRKRLFLIARCDGLPIVWPEATHTKDEHTPAHSIIDWSLDCPSVFGKRPSGRPLAKATMDRIAKGLERFVFNQEVPTPFIIRTGHAWKDGTVPGGWRGQSLNDPLATVCATNDKNLVVPFIARHWGGMVGKDITHPWPTVTERCAQDQLAAAFLTKFYGTSVGSDARSPLGTVTAGGWKHGLVEAFLLKYYGTGGPRSVSEPLDTLTTKARYGLVEVYGEQYQLVDVGMRMLQPHELYAAQDFPEDYDINPVLPTTGKRITKTDQLRLCGNSVVPRMSKVLVEANYQ